MSVSVILKKFSNLKDKHWILTLAFLVDILNLCDHLNVLNLWLQGENILFPYAISNISAFKSKLALYRTQLENYDYSYFEFLKSVICQIILGLNFIF